MREISKIEIGWRPTAADWLVRGVAASRRRVRVGCRASDVGRGPSCFVPAAPGSLATKDGRKALMADTWTSDVGTAGQKCPHLAANTKDFTETFHETLHAARAQLPVAWDDTTGRWFVMPSPGSSSVRSSDPGDGGRRACEGGACSHALWPFRRRTRGEMLSWREPSRSLSTLTAPAVSWPCRAPR